MRRCKCSDGSEAGKKAGEHREKEKAQCAQLSSLPYGSLSLQAYGDAALGWAVRVGCCQLQFGLPAAK